MMKVAGKTEEDEDLPLLTDEGDDTTMDGPVYPEGTVRLRLGDLRALVVEVIKKSGSKWVLYAKHKKGGKRRKLGSHASKASAERQERAIHAHGG